MTENMETVENNCRIVQTVENYVFHYMKIPSAVAGGKKPLRNVKGRYWYELLMRRCVAVALFPPQLLAEQ